MGYRSEVGLCLAPEAQIKLEAGLLNLVNEAGTGSAEKEKLIRELFQMSDIKKDDVSGTAAYYWSWLKWYDDYPEVAFVEGFVNALEDDEYYFLRLGESADDVEMKGAFWDNPFGMTLSRSIAFD
jgi:hypothetical protein